MIVPGKAVVAALFGHDSLNGKKSKLRPWHKPKLRRNVNSALVIGFRGRTAVAHTQGVEQQRRKEMLMFECQILVAGALFGEINGRLVVNLPVHVAIVKGVATEEGVLFRKAVIDAALHKVFVGRLRRGKLVLHDSVSLLGCVSRRRREE